MLHLYLLSYIVFALVLHLYLLEHGGGFYFIEIIDLSCLTYIILRVLNSMVICFNCEINPNVIGIQDEHNKKTSILSSLNIMRSLILDKCFEI